MMKILKSIKWRLQLWYGLILIAVLAGFGITAYQLQRSRQFQRVDDELHRRFSVIASALRRPPPMRQPDVADDMDRPPPDRLNEDGPPPREFRRHDRFQLPPNAIYLFGETDIHNFYFVINGRDGQEIASSTNLPPGLPQWPQSFVRPARDNNGPGAGRISPLFLTWKQFRATIDALPSGETIQVGCSVASEQAELHRSALIYVGFGGLILVFGLGGGWWFVSRSLQPVSNISATAVKISAGDLSQRINTADAESELGQLAAVLNSTFARLEAAFAQQKQFTSDAAHELRTPVSVILTQTQTALHRERDAAGYKQTVEACQRAAQRMKKLIESLLALARFDAGQEVLKRLRFDLAKTAHDCADMVQPLATQREVKVILETDPLEITGDPERLSQVITNLLTNAIQYNHPQGEVRVQVRAQDGLAVLSVSDTGQGIGSAEFAPCIRTFLSRR